MKNLRILIAWVLCCGALTSVAEAQLLRAVYPVKVVCGFVEGNVPLLSSTPGQMPRGFESLKPGNYATTVNVFHAEPFSDTLVAFFRDVSNGTTVSLGSTSLGGFQSLDYTCPQIAQLLGATTAFDGWLLLFATDLNFEISPVYTYESQNAFWDRRFYQYGPGTPIVQLGTPGIHPNWFFVQRSALPNSIFPNNYAPIGTYSGPLGTVPAPGPVPGPTSGTGVITSAMGGLGLGASIDVERVPGRALKEPVEASDLGAGDLGLY